METKSFTLRLPIEVFNAIAEQAEEGKRSEFIIQLLKESLGLEDEEEKTKRIDALRLADRLNELAYKVEIIQTVHDTVLQRLAKVETALQGKTDSQTDSKAGTIFYSNTSSNTEEVKNLELLPEDTTIPENAQKMKSPSLLEILRGLEPKQGWDPQKLRLFRDGKKKNAWHQVGRYKFKLAEQNNSTKRPEYLWWVIELES